MKKVLALALAFVLIMSLSVTAFATAPDPASPVHTDIGAGTDPHGTADSAVVGEEGLFTEDTHLQYYAQDADGNLYVVTLDNNNQITAVKDVNGDTVADEDFIAGLKIMGVANSYTAETEFWLNVDKDATRGETTIYGEGSVTDNNFAYVVDYETVIHSNIQVTVPLYVCMYGFGGDGTVVVPTASEYAIKNTSSYSRDSKITAVTEFVAYEPDFFKVMPLSVGRSFTDIDNNDDVTKVVTADGTKYYEKATGMELTVDGTNGSWAKNLVSAADMNALLSGKSPAEAAVLKGYVATLINATLTNNSKTAEVSAAELIERALSAGGYGFFYGKEDNKLYAKEIGDFVAVPAVGGDTLYYKTRETGGTLTQLGGFTVGHYYGAKTKATDLGADLEAAIGNDENTPAFNMANTNIGVDVVTLQAKRPGGWNIVSASTPKADMRAHEFTLTIKSLDMFEVYSAADNTLDIGELLWTVPASDGTNPGILPLPITSGIAGNSVNEDTHTNVLNVAYTIVPKPFA